MNLQGTLLRKLCLRGIFGRQRPRFRRTCVSMSLSIGLVAVSCFSLSTSGNALISRASCAGKKNKRIVICLDGTGVNRHDDNPDSNPARMVTGIHATGQEVAYHYGIGAELSINEAKKVIEQATGNAINDHMKSCYEYICKNYDEGDDLYLIGFSRGAFTALSLAGMLDVVGIVPCSPKDDLYLKSVVDEGFAAYKSHKTNPKDLEVFYDKYNPQVHAPVKFLGLFDTVASLGLSQQNWLSRNLPSFLRIFTNPTKQAVNFHVNAVPDNVELAAHAVSIDESRRDFKPTLQDPSKGNVVQWWFAGVHTDIGGGYPDDTLSTVTLKWMVERAEEQGLEFDPAWKGALEKPENLFPELHTNAERGKPSDVNGREWRDIPHNGKISSRAISMLRENESYRRECNPKLLQVKKVLEECS